jgi:hypothetical protein
MTMRLHDKYFILSASLIGVVLLFYAVASMLGFVGESAILLKVISVALLNYAVSFLLFMWIEMR